MDRSMVSLEREKILRSKKYSQADLDPGSQKTVVHLVGWGKLRRPFQNMKWHGRRCRILALIQLLPYCLDLVY